MNHKGKRCINLGGLWHSAVASQPCPSGHITADKRLRYASPKLSSATSFIRIPIGGVFTSFLMELLVYPAIYLIWKWHFEVKPGRKKQKRI